MKRIVIFLILFLIAGSLTALGYAFYQLGSHEKNQNNEQATNGDTDAMRTASEKDLSWMKEIIGISDDDAPKEKEVTTEEETQETTTTSTMQLQETSASSTSDLNPTEVPEEDRNEQPKTHEISIEDMGKMDALESTVYDYASRSLSLNAEVRQRTVLLTWTQTASTDFVEYQILRSEQDENPYLPKTTSIKTISDVTQTFYTDSRAKEDTTYYYRICMTRSDTVPACGNVLKIRF